MVEDKTEIQNYDGQEIYCRKLGHHLQFRYCRQEQQQLPCTSIRRCWQSRIPVEEFLDSSFSPHEVNYLDESHIPKISTILDIVQKVRKENSNKAD
ncbi:MAG: hypothetical protein V1720_06075 [bacterium]